jgi:hypothetical protein
MKRVKNMKKTLFFILTITSLAAALPARNLSLALTASYLGKADGGFKEVYGAGGVLPGLRFEAAVWKGLSLYGAYGYFGKTGATPVLKQEAKTRQHFLAAGAAWRGALAPRLDWTVYTGLLYVIYNEEALGETITGSAPGVEIGASLDCKISPRLFLFPFAAYMLASDTVMGNAIKLGGFKAGLGAGIRF